jgi:hypothetical protein
MGSGTDSIVRCRRGGAALLNSASTTALAALSLGLALGVALPRDALAGPGTVNPVQTSTYLLGTHNPTTFGAGTNINAVSPWNIGVYGGAGMSGNVANYGAIQGPSGGFYLKSSGSTVTNWGAIGGNAGVGVLLPNGGTVTNQSGGSISGYAGVDIAGGIGTVANAGSITGRANAVLVASGSVNNQSGRTTYEMQRFGAIDELQSVERQNAVSIERGLEGEVEPGEGLDRRQPGHLNRHPDATVLARGQLFGE